MDALRRRAHRAHRWLGLVVGLQVFAWLAGGLVMTALPIERVRGEHRVAAAAPLSVRPASLIPFEAAAAAASADRVAAGSLEAFLGRPAWRVEGADGTAVLVDALTGAVLSPLDEGAARAVALADYAGPGTLAGVRLLEEPPSEYARSGPGWRAVFDDADRTALYVTADTGEVAARRGRTWRAFDLAWRVHVMDYDDGADFNHPLVRAMAGAGTLFAASGLLLMGLRWRRGRLA